MKIYYQTCHYQDMDLFIAVKDKQLICIEPGKESIQKVKQWLTKHFGSVELIESEDETEVAAEQVLQYLEGERAAFDIPYEAVGTDFQKSVWAVVNHIPYGETRTYGEIAEEIGRPTAIRAVAGAIGANPLLFICPCHRVIGKDGKLTGYRGGVPMKEKLLQLERR